MAYPSVPYVVAWVDPGLLSGLAAWYPENRFYTATILDFNGTGAALELLPDGPLVWCGYERFTVTMQTIKLTQYDPNAMNVIGMVMWIARRKGWRLLPPQFPAERKVARSDMLKKVGMHPGPQRDDDALSASQHLLAFLLNSRLLPADLRAKI
jgi:hypothetical protein